MIKLVRRFFDSRAKVITRIPADNDYIIIRHQLFLKLLDISTALLFIGSFAYLFLDINSVLKFNGAVPLLLLVLTLSINIVYLKTQSLRIAGTMLSFTLYLAFAIPAFSHIVAINYPTYFLLLLPILALLTLGRPALVISGLIATASMFAILSIYDVNNYSIETIAADERANIVIGGFYILSYILIIYSCSSYERIITNKKKEILTIRKALSKQSKLDPLLNIYSRKALIGKFNQLKAHTNPLAQKVSIIALTLNGLRTLNQQYGQNFANDVLQIITARMTYELDKNDIIGRISGNEFIIIKMTNDSKAISIFFDKLQKYVCEPVSFDGHTTKISIAAGHIFYNKDQGDLTAHVKIIEMKSYHDPSVNTGSE
jgi:diguanylate cyclase (GGDEF)-like protein